MRPINPMSIIPKYAKDSTYIDGPTPAQQEAGMIPLDTVPADWWNKLFQQLSEQVNNACNGMATAYNEILNVLSAANIQPDATQNDQLARAITNLRQTVANAANAGAVKSSATSGKVSVDANGIMTPNGMGVPTALNTTTKEIVSAINELKSVYDQAIQSINSSISALNSGKAPSYHATAETTYGVGNGTQYGHLKISDAYLNPVGGADAGVAASQGALHAAYNSLVNLIGQSSQIPQGLSPTPVLSLTTPNGTATFHVTRSGFYYVFVAGANGGAGGHTKASNSVGGAGGLGEQIGQILYLMPGDYVCRTGSDGAAGGNGYGSAGGAGGLGFHYGNTGGSHSGSYSGAGGGAGGGSSAFYRSPSAPVLLIEACGGGGGGGGGGTKSGSGGGPGGHGGGPGYYSGGTPGTGGGPYAAGVPGFSYPQLVGSIFNACIHIHACV